MDEPRTLRHGDKEVVIFTTPSGVRAIVATCVSEELLRKMAAKLKRSIRRDELRRARELLKSQGR